MPSSEGGHRGCESETVPRVNGRTISLGPCGQQRSPVEITLVLAAARAARLVVASSFRDYGMRRLKLPTWTVFPEFSSGLEPEIVFSEAVLEV
jgi:hypothetical protein